MKILSGNILYEFTVSQIDAPNSNSSVEIDEIQIEFHYRKFQSPSQTPDFEEHRSIKCHRESTQSFVTDALQEFEVQENSRVDMATHFRFYLDRLLRMRRSCSSGGASISVKVSLDAKEISPERAAAIGRRRERVSESERERASRRMTVEMMETVVDLPAKKAVVEKLVRERVVVVDDDRECAICLEKFGERGEGIELLCLHVYHKECIIQWLGRSHVCPFCRFKLPC